MKIMISLVVVLVGWISVGDIKANPGVHQQEIETVTLLFTNDFESTYDPVMAFWRDDMARIGGIAELATLIDQIRNTEPNVFLFDSGDIFTGTLAKLTLGEAVSYTHLTLPTN